MEGRGKILAPGEIPAPKTAKRDLPAATLALKSAGICEVVSRDHQLISCAPATYGSVVRVCEADKSLNARGVVETRVSVGG